MDERWVALLRAVNVGGRNAVPMAELRRVCVEAGCDDVTTYIASGNVIFTAPSSGRKALARRLEDAIEEAFGVAATVLLRTGAELRATVEAHPFGADTSHTHVTFLAAEPRPEAIRRLSGRDVGDDRIRVVGINAYLLLPNGLGQARLTGAIVERELGVPGTTRNWRTTVRLAELAVGDPSQG